MGADTRIEWCTHTWSPWIGCTRVSAACDHCYAADMAHRYGWARFETGAPRHRTSAAYWRQPRIWNRKAQANGVRESVFPSLCDPFDGEVSDAWRDDLCAMAIDTPALDWLLLTKRPHLAGKYFADRKVPANVWLGTTAEDQKMADLRIPQLLAIDAPKRFLSIEPMLGPIDLAWAISRNRLDIAAGFLQRGRFSPGMESLRPIDWVIAGGESGPKARPSNPAWFHALRDQCADAGVPFFFKQWGEWAPGEAFGLQQDGPITTRRGDVGKWMKRYVVCADRGDRLDGHSFTAHATDLVYRVGKKRAGALLDGQLHRAVPT